MTAVLPANAAASPEPRRLALSPSRAADFKRCPLLYRLRAIDRLPEPPTPAATRGTLVHAVLEDMFRRPAAERTERLVREQVGPRWAKLVAERPELARALEGHDAVRWLASAEQLVSSYFGLEDPTRFEPEGVELALEIDVGDGVPLRGFLDRLDRAPTGELRVVDYKTGRSPDPDFESRALYQLKFYALMIFRLRGVVPTHLTLLYLGDDRRLTYLPSAPELVAFERSVIALWEAVRRALDAGEFPARRSGVCGLCSYQAHCPEFGGTPPPYRGPGQGSGTPDGAAPDALVPESELVP